MRGGLEALSNRKLYHEYLRRLDARAVLDHYGVEHAYEQSGKEGTTELVHSCLLDHVEPHHSNGDSNPSACCNLEKKLYICYSYWGGDLIHFIMKMEKKDDLSGALSTIGQFLGDATVSADQFLSELDTLFSKPGGVYDIDIPSYSERVLLPWAVSHPYIREVRGISQEASSRLQIGFDISDNRITFPHFWKGKLVGWQKRAIPRRPGKWPGTEPDWPKYKNSTGFPKSDTLYGMDLLTQRKAVCVVESPMSVARAATLDPNIPVVATFGAKISDRQIDILKSFGEVMVWMDPDMAGWGAEKKLVRGLYRHTKVTVITSDPGMDLGDYSTLEDVQEKIENRATAVTKLAGYDKEWREYVRGIRD